jgi:hypothetical protein
MFSGGGHETHGRAQVLPQVKTIEDPYSVIGPIHRYTKIPDLTKQASNKTKPRDPRKGVQNEAIALDGRRKNTEF